MNGKWKSVLALALVFNATIAQVVKQPSQTPNPAQRAQIERKYGMFIHFGINTFCDQEWTDGSVPPTTYKPTAIDADQWVQTAKAVGMKYVILTAKHHEGFCLWDSQFTDYDVANSGNKTNVVEAVANACKKHNIGLGIYYSLWDRHQNPDVKNKSLDAAYNQYITNQLKELLTITQKAGVNVVEFWFDGGWEKANDRWPIESIYKTIKSRQPDCQVGVNWTIGLPNNPDAHPVLPKDQKAGYPIRYFPSDFRLGDPYLPADPDPKVFTHGGKEYYMPWESTFCLSKKWFYHTQDTTYKPVDELAELYKTATAQNNILIINSPPNRNGKIREADVTHLKALWTKIEAGRQAR